MGTSGRFLSQLTIMAGLLAIMLLTSACKPGSESGKNGNDEDEEAAPIPVETRVVKRGPITAVYSGTAALEVDAEADITAKVGGEIVTILIEEGDEVSEGQVLARLDGDRLQLEVERQRANVRRVQQDYQRNVELNRKGLVSAGAFEGMKFELDALRAALQLAQLELSYTEIKAPFSGVVAERYVRRGNTVNVGMPLFKITDLDPLLAYLHVPEKEFNKLSAGQLAVIETDALRGEQYQGRVARVSPVIDSDTGTFKVTVEVNDADARLKPGMFGRIGIVYDTRENSMLVPRSALVDTDSDAAVFVIEDDTAHRRLVTTGYASGADVEIVDGLTGNEQIVVIGQNTLKDGGKVRIVPAGEPDSRTAVDETTSADPAG